MLQVGCAKAEITAFKRGVGMLGYGLFSNTMEAVETPLFARAVAFDDDGKLFCFVNVELAFVTPSLKYGVLHLLSRQAPELALDDRNLMLTAQHTHSGPGGFSFHCLYNLTTPGFVYEIYETIVKGIVAAIVDAHDQRCPATVSWGRGEFDPSNTVGTIRSIRAYNRNPEVTQPFDRTTAHLGINREMKLLKLATATGGDLGCISWFGTHATNLSNDNNKVCSDNKGYAARFLEDALAPETEGHFQAIFAQGACGDVSPKLVRNRRRARQRGKYDGDFPDDIESAQSNGRLQFQKALEIYRRASRPGASTSIRCWQRVEDFGNIDLDPDFVGGRSGLATSPGCFGVSFIGGSPVDGPGAHPLVVSACRMLTRLVRLCECSTSGLVSKRRAQDLSRKYKAQGRKHVLIESGERRVLGTKRIHRSPVPAFVDPATRYFKRFHLTGAIENHAWTPQVLPIQLVCLGDTALAAFPFEITTIAARRLTATAMARRRSISRFWT